MAHAKTAKVRGLRESLKATIVKNLSNTKNKIIALPDSEDPAPLFGIRAALLEELVRLSEKTITDLNDSPDLDNLIAELDAATTEAKREAERLANVARTISEFSAMLGRIEAIAGKIIDIAA